MARRFSTLLTGLALIAAMPLAAQIVLPGGGLPSLPSTDGLLNGPLGTAGQLLDGTTSQVTAAMRQARLDRIDGLLRSNRAVLERDAVGEPARRGVLLLIDPDQASLDRAVALGFTTGRQSEIEGLGIAVVELVLPAGTSLAKGEQQLRRALPSVTIASDQIHFQSGARSERPAGFAHPALAPVNVPIGIIDGAPAQPVLALRGFAKGAPAPSNHGSAVASLASWAGARQLMVADVYGVDPAGGSSLAIGQAIGWLVSSGARVISISLVGPRNALVERAIRAAQARGVVLVAAVGNDGAAAPTSYPASYNGVLAITGVDRRNRVLIEAGRASHVDYAAPGGDVQALDRNGRKVAVRGTSFAAPLVAVRAAAAFERGLKPGSIRSALDSEAIPLSKRRPDPRSGRGLICSVCR